MDVDGPAAAAPAPAAAAAAPAAGTSRQEKRQAERGAAKETARCVSVDIERPTDPLKPSKLSRLSKHPPSPTPLRPTDL